MLDVDCVFWQSADLINLSSYDFVKDLNVDSKHALFRGLDHVLFQ